MFWEDILQVFLLVFGPCRLTQLVLFFIPFSIFLGVLLWLRWLVLPSRDNN